MCEMRFSTSLTSVLHVRLICGAYGSKCSGLYLHVWRDAEPLHARRA